MKRAIAIVGILALLVTAAPVVTQAGETAAAKVLKSIARVDITMTSEGETGHGICTAFSINQKAGYWLTAAHCFGNVAIQVNGQLSTVVYFNETSDLMVLSVPGYRAPALHPSKTPISIGQTIYALGYGYGVLMLRTGHVSNAEVQPPFTAPGQFVMLQDIGLIGGMSGGPVFDDLGEVVSINQMGQDAPPLGIGRVLRIIMAETAQFWR